MRPARDLAVAMVALDSNLEFSRKDTKAGQRVRWHSDALPSQVVYRIARAAVGLKVVRFSGAYKFRTKAGSPEVQRRMAQQVLDLPSPSSGHGNRSRPRAGLRLHPDEHEVRRFTLLI